MRLPTRETVRLVLLGIGVGAVVATMVAVSVGVFIILDNSAKAQQQRVAALRVANETKALSRLLVECTTAPKLREPPVDPATLPPDDCYARQQRAQGDLVGEPAGPLNTVSVAAAACAVRYGGDPADTLACTKRAVAAATR